MNNCTKLLLLVLLVKPVLGQQGQASVRFERLVAAAQKAQAANDYAGAVSAYKQAVAIEPNMPELWTNFGLMQHEAGAVSDAIVSFQNAIRLNPSLYVPNLFLGIDYVRTGKTSGAIPLLARAEKLNKTDPQAPLALGRAYVVTGKFSAAARELDRATTLDPKLGSAWFTLGIALLDQVEEDARRMSEEGKQSAFAGALYAESLRKQARFGEAASLYRTLLDLQPQPPCIRSELGFALIREHEPAEAASEFTAERAAHPECGMAILGQAHLAIDNGDTVQAAKLLTELWQRDHGFAIANAAAALEGLPKEKASSVDALASTQGDAAVPAELRAALLNASNPADLSATDSQAPSEPAGKSTRAAVGYYRAGEFRKCASSLESATGVPGIEKTRLLAECSYLTGDDRGAANAASDLEKLQPHSLEALYWSIRANEHLAFKALARFQELEPDSARNHILLGDIYHQLERHDDAQAEYQKALAIAPGDPAALLGLASAYLSNNNLAGAMETARAALAGRPDDPDLNLVVAEALMGRDEYAQAEGNLMKCLHTKPQMLPRVHADLGKVYAETGRTQEAIEQLKLGLPSDENGAIEYLLSRLYRKVGDSKAASEALERMKAIKEQRRIRGVKLVEDPDLSSQEFPSASTP